MPILRGVRGAAAANEFEIYFPSEIDAVIMFYIISDFRLYASPSRLYDRRSNLDTGGHNHSIDGGSE